ECPVYFPAAMPLCKSAMVNSSSSNGGRGRLDDVEAIEVFVITTLTLARPAPPITPLRTNVLRFMFFLLDGWNDGAMPLRLSPVVSEPRAIATGTLSIWQLRFLICHL